MLNKTLALGLLVAALLPTSSQASKSRDYPLGEKAHRADFVFIGEVESRQVLSHPKPGLHTYVEVMVVENIKGQLKRRVRFVTSASVGESGSACDEPGETYLFFARRGYPSFSIRDELVVTTVHGKSTYVSPANSRYSCYRVRAIAVVEGINGATSAMPLSEALEQIRKVSEEDPEQP